MARSKCNEQLAHPQTTEHYARMDDDTFDLTGKLLLAMPELDNTAFAQSVILICSHDDDGAMGLIINKPRDNIDFRMLLDEMDIPTTDQRVDPCILFGGPVEGSRGFVVHRPAYHSDLSTLQVTESVAMTSTIDVIEDIANGSGPQPALLALGYAGWGLGQLEAEIADNGWLIAEAADDIIFGDDNAGKWVAALQSIGVDPKFLSTSFGHA